MKFSVNPLRVPNFPFFSPNGVAYQNFFLFLKYFIIYFFILFIFYLFLLKILKKRINLKFADDEIINY